MKALRFSCSRGDIVISFAKIKKKNSENCTHQQKKREKKSKRRHNKVSPTPENRDDAKYGVNVKAFVFFGDVR